MNYLALCLSLYSTGTIDTIFLTIFMISLTRCLFLILSAVCFFFQSCYSPHIPLSFGEKAFVDSLSKSFQGEVSLFHQFETTDKNESDSVLYFDIKNSRLNLCQMDSGYLKKLSSALTEKLVRVLNHKSNYSHIDIEFSTTKKPDKRTEMVTCVKVIRTNINPPYEATIFVNEGYE